MPAAFAVCKETEVLTPYPRSLGGALALCPRSAFGTFLGHAGSGLLPSVWGSCLVVRVPARWPELRNVPDHCHLHPGEGSTLCAGLSSSRAISPTVQNLVQNSEQIQTTGKVLLSPQALSRAGTLGSVDRELCWFAAGALPHGALPSLASDEHF